MTSSLLAKRVTAFTPTCLWILSGILATSCFAKEPGWADAFPAWSLKSNRQPGDASLLKNGSFLGAAGASAIDGWELENPDLVKAEVSAPPGENAVNLLRVDLLSGGIAQTVDVGAFQGKKMIFTFEAVVRGGVAPYFVIESLDGPKGRFDAGKKLEPTTVLGQFNSFGWFYDFRYGWPYNIYLGHLFKKEWQPIGAVFTVPKGVSRIKIRLEPRPAHYRIFDKRKEISRDGSVSVRRATLVQAIEQQEDKAVAALAATWEKESFDADSFLYLSYVYNQAIIKSARIRMQLWQSWRLAASGGGSGSESRDKEKIVDLGRRLEGLEQRLAGLRAFYIRHYRKHLAAADLQAVFDKYEGASSSTGRERGAWRNDKRVTASLYIQELIDHRFQTGSALVASLNADLERLQADSSKEADRLAESRGGTLVDLKSLDLTDDPSILPSNGHCPPILFTTGNTSIPLRIYKDIGIDLFSMNYSAGSLNDQGMRENTMLSTILNKYHLKELSAVFTPIHGLFALSGDLLQRNPEQIKEILRVDSGGRITVHERDTKTGLRTVSHPKLDEFFVKPDHYYWMPLNPLAPEAWKLIADRMKVIGDYVSSPENRQVIAAVELSAEAPPVIGPLNEPWTRAAFIKFLQEKFGSLDSLNQKIGSVFTDWNEIAEEPALDSKDTEMAVYRLKIEFNAMADADVYGKMRAELHNARPDLTVVNRNNSTFFADFNYSRIPRKDDYIDYHASYDRGYGYWLGRSLGMDQITGEEMVVLPTGMRERHTVAQAYSNALKGVWKFARWGTKTICAWRPYPAPVFQSIGPVETDYTILNENWAGFPYMKDFVRGFGRVLDGEIIRPRAGILQLEQQGHVSWYMPAVQTLDLYWRSRYIDFAYVFEQALTNGKDRLSNYDVLAVPPSLFVSDETQNRLLAWVKEGGTLITFGPLGLYNEYVRPSQKLMDAVFGPAGYHLVGTEPYIRNHEGYWLSDWKDLSEKATPIPAAKEIILPDPGAPRLMERKYNYDRSIKPFKPEAPLEPGQFEERAMAGSYGKGAVFYIPRDLLSDSYGQALAQWLEGKGIDLRDAWCDQPSFVLTRRKPTQEAGDAHDYLFVQNLDEWNGLRTATVSVRGAYSKLEEVTDRKWAVPLQTEFKDGVTSFEVVLAPGEIAVIRQTARKE